MDDPFCWRSLSNEERAACIGELRESLCCSKYAWNVKGRLQEYWNCHVFPVITNLVHSNYKHVYKKGGVQPLLSLQLYWLSDVQDPTTAQPTVFIITSDKKAASRVRKLISKHEVFRSLDTRFDVLYEGRSIFWRAGTPMDSDRVRSTDDITSLCAAPAVLRQWPVRLESKERNTTIFCTIRIEQHLFAILPAHVLTWNESRDVSHQYDDEFDSISSTLSDLDESDRSDSQDSIENSYQAGTPPPIEFDAFEGNPIADYATGRQTIYVKNLGESSDGTTQDLTLLGSWNPQTLVEPQLFVQLVNRRLDYALIRLERPGNCISNTVRIPGSGIVHLKTCNDQISSDKVLLASGWSGVHEVGISTTSALIFIPGIQQPLRVWELRHVLAPGDSGSPVLNTNGEILGMAVATVPEHGITYVVPASDIFHNICSTVERRPDILSSLSSEDILELSPNLPIRILTPYRSSSDPAEATTSALRSPHIKGHDDQEHEPRDSDEQARYHAMPGAEDIVISKHDALLQGKDTKEKQLLIETTIEQNPRILEREDIPQDTTRTVVMLEKEQTVNISWRSSLSETSVEALVQLLQGEDSHVRYSAAKALVQLLQDKDSRTRYSAVEALVQLLQDESINIRHSAVKALVRLLQDEDSHIRSTAVMALRWQSQLPLVAIDASVRLLKDKDKDSSIRESAMEILRGQSQLPNTAVKALVQLLQDQDSYIRYSVVGALEWQSRLPVTAVNALVRLLQDEDSRIRYSAVNTLRRQSQLPVAAVNASVRLLKDKDEDSSIRESAMEILRGQSQLPNTAITALVQLLQDQDSYIRHSVVGALEWQSRLPVTAVNALARLLKDEDEDSSIRKSAWEVLRRQKSLTQTAFKAVSRFSRGEISSVLSSATGILEQPNQSSRTADTNETAHMKWHKPKNEPTV